MIYLYHILNKFMKFVDVIKGLDAGAAYSFYRSIKDKN